MKFPPLNDKNEVKSRLLGTILGHFGYFGHFRYFCILGILGILGFSSHYIPHRECKIPAFSTFQLINGKHVKPVFNNKGPLFLGGVTP